MYIDWKIKIFFESFVLHRADMRITNKNKKFVGESYSKNFTIFINL